MANLFYSNYGSKKDGPLPSPAEAKEEQECGQSAKSLASPLDTNNRFCGRSKSCVNSARTATTTTIADSPPFVWGFGGRFNHLSKGGGVHPFKQKLKGGGFTLCYHPFAACIQPHLRLLSRLSIKGLSASCLVLGAWTLFALCRYMMHRTLKTEEDSDERLEKPKPRARAQKFAKLYPPSSTRHQAPGTNTSSIIFYKV